MSDPVAKILQDYIDETERKEAEQFDEVMGYFEDVRAIVGNPQVAQIIHVTQTELALQEMAAVLYGGENAQVNRGHHRTAVGRLFGNRTTAPNDQPGGGASA